MDLRFSGSCGQDTTILRTVVATVRFVLFRDFAVGLHKCGSRSAFWFGGERHRRHPACTLLGSAGMLEALLVK